MLLKEAMYDFDHILRWASSPQWLNNFCTVERFSWGWATTPDGASFCGRESPSCSVSLPELSGASACKRELHARKIALQLSPKYRYKTCQKSLKKLQWSPKNAKSHKSYTKGGNGIVSSLQDFIAFYKLKSLPLKMYRKFLHFVDQL